MSKIFISGLLNLETTLKVDNFPIHYNPIEYPFFGVSSSISGVGYNVSKALKTLDNEVKIYSYLGNDEIGDFIVHQLNKENIDTSYIIHRNNSSTASSVVLYDNEGKRKIYCDLKDLQDINECNLHIDYSSFDLAILTNINFSRPLLKKFFDADVCIASDVHVLNDINDEYNKDFLYYSNILFLSNEAIKGKEKEFIKQIYDKYHNDIIVIGKGNEGSLLYIGKEDKYISSTANAYKGVVNTLGAGDALFSSFIHYYLKTKDIETSIKFATIFAGLKISTSGGAKGFEKEEEVLSYLK